MRVEEVPGLAAMGVVEVVEMQQVEVEVLEMSLAVEVVAGP